MDHQEEFIRQLYELGLSDEEVTAKLEELNATEKPASAAASEPAKAPGLISKETVIPGIMAGLKTPDATDNSEFGTQKKQGFTEPFQGDIPGDAGNYSSGTLNTAAGAIGDTFGAGFRLLGALIPQTRGKTVDATSGQERPRTFTEAIQNPSGSLTTPLDEGLDKTNLPAPVKLAGHVALGAAQGFGAGVVTGTAKGLLKSATAGIRESAGNVMVKGADAVQNLRLGVGQKDLLDGYTPRTLAREGLNKLSPAEAYKKTEAELASMTKRANAIKGATEDQIDIGPIIAATRKELLSKKFNFSRDEVENTLSEIQATISGQLERDGGSVATRQPFVPRQPVFQLSAQEIAAKAKTGEIKFVNRGNRAVPEYAAPEVAPDNFLPDPGEITAKLNFIDANLLKTEVGKEAAFQHLAGRVRGDKAANAAEQVYNRFYSNLKRTVDPLGGPELQAINKRFSELIPVQNVLTRAMTREELGAALGRADIPTTKFGFVRAAMRATKTDRAVMLNNAGESLQAAGAADASATVPFAVGSGIRSSVGGGILRGALSGSNR